MINLVEKTDGRGKAFFRITRWNAISKDNPTENIFVHKELATGRTNENKNIDLLFAEIQQTLADIIGRLGLQGWEMFQVVFEDHRTEGCTKHYFKRQIPDELPLEIADEKPKRASRRKSSK